MVKVVKPSALQPTTSQTDLAVHTTSGRGDRTLTITDIAVYGAGMVLYGAFLALSLGLARLQSLRRIVRVEKIS